MRHTPLDAKTMALARNIVRAARRLGRDEVEDLHRVGLINSPHVRREAQLQVLQTLLDILYNTTPAEMWRRNRNSMDTPRAMYDIMVEFLEEYKETI